MLYQCHNLHNYPKMFSCHHMRALRPNVLPKPFPRLLSRERLRARGPPPAGGGGEEAESKKISPISSAAGAALPNNNNRKQSLGAFHHLAPMRKPSGLEGKLGDIRKSMASEGGGLGPVGGLGGGRGGGLGGSAPWDPFGKPVLGKKEAKPL